MKTLKGRTVKKKVKSFFIGYKPLVFQEIKEPDCLIGNIEDGNILRRIL